MTDYRKRIDEAISTGHVWRAKEVLQGRLADAVFDTELFRNYGSVFKQMGDLRLAGKYFFLSGNRSQEYNDCIKIFLERDCAGPFSNFWGTMPKAAQRSPKTAIPTIIIEELLNLGFDRAEIDGVFKKIEEEIAGRKNRELENSSGTEKLSVYLLIAIVCLLLLGLLFQAVIGVIALSRFVMSLIGT